MYNISSYLENKIIGHTLLNSPYTPASTVYAGLFSSMSDDGDSSTELNAADYVRMPITFVAPLGGVSTNTITTWSAALSDWGNVAYIGILDTNALGTGNLLWWGQMPVVKRIALSAKFTIRAADITVSMGGAFGLYLRNGLINLTLRNGVLANPANVYIGVGTGVSSDYASLSEPSPAAGYSRQGPASFTHIGTSDSVTINNTGTDVISFIAAGAWGLITHVGLYDDPTSGNLLYALELPQPRYIYDGDGIDFDEGSITLRIS